MIQAAVANMSEEEQAKEIKQMKPTVRERRGCPVAQLPCLGCCHA
jgi:hypothetical protein